MKLSSRLFLFLLWFYSPLALFATTYINSDLTHTTTWHAHQSPIIITNSIKIQTGVSLTIEEGTEVYFSQKTTLTVQGELIAWGSHQKRIHFAGWLGASWGGILFENSCVDYNQRTGEGIRFAHCTFKGNGQFPTIMLRASGCSLLLQHCHLTSCHTAIQVERQGSIQLEESVVRACHRVLNIRNTASGRILNNKITNCHSILLGGTTLFEGNILKRFDSPSEHSGMIVWMIGGGKVIIRDNLFSRFDNYALKLYKLTKRSSVLIERNTFKNNTVNLQLSCQYHNKGKVVIENNNFYACQDYQVMVYGPCYEHETSTPILIGSNYWGDLSSRELYNVTMDQRKNSRLNARVSYSSLLPSSTGD